MNIRPIHTEADYRAALGNVAALMESDPAPGTPKGDRLATSSRYFGVQFFLEDLLGRRVDLVTDEALRHELRPNVEPEALHV